MKKGGYWLFAMALSVLLCGCRPSANPNISARLVTEMVITEESTLHFTRRYYNANEKMQLILLYIRSLGPKFKPKEDPEQLQGQTICIHMRYADGSSKRYRQKDNLYFQEGDQPWERIDPEKGAALWRILLHTPSDPEPEMPRHIFLPRITGPWHVRGMHWHIRRQTEENT